jgi:hypothetical protein
MMFNFLSEHPKTNHKSRRRPRRSWSPRLEALEDRALPSTLTVTSAADNGAAGTLRALLAAAHNGDTIQFSNHLDGSTITLTAGQLPVDASVTIKGPGANELTISGNSASRIFNVASGVTSTISGLTLTRGSATDGAGILNYGNLTLSNDVVGDNIAQGISGGGLFGDGGGRGGGVENQSGATLDVSNCTFSGDEANAAMDVNTGTAGYGGGIDNEGGTLSVVQSVLSGNLAVGGPGGKIFGTYYGYTFAYPGGPGSGGAVHSTNGALTISGCTINNNTARGGTAGSLPPGAFGGGGDAQGGGIASSHGTLILTSSMFSNNEALVSDSEGVASGGGASVGGASTATISNTTFMNNQATATATAFNVNTSGGGLVIGGSILQMNGCLFTGNVANGGTAQGGGMLSGSGGSISNTTFTGNVVEGNDGGEALGGGLELTLFTPSSEATLSLNDCNFTQNVAEAVAGTFITDAEGGGIFISGETTATATNCNVTGNTASLAQGAALTGFTLETIGGGVDVDYMSSFTLTNSTISGNRAIGGPGSSGGSGGLAEGGGLNADYGSSLTITNALIAGNIAQGGVGGAAGAGGLGDGGGISCTDSTLSVTNSTLVGNSAQGGQGGSGGAGGLGQGGGIFASFFSFHTSVNLDNCVVTVTNHGHRPWL